MRDMRAAHFVLTTPSCGRTNGTGTRREIFLPRLTFENVAETFWSRPA
jgi:hypothetical protein